VDKLNKIRVKELRDTLQRCLDHKVSEIASWVDDWYDVAIGNGSFNDDEVTFKLNVKIKGSKTQAQKDLEIYGGMDNLDLTKIAKLDGKDFSLSGFRRKARTKPYLIQDLKNGGEYIITTEVAKKYFGKGEVA
jgi:hypothetical protein